MRLVLQDGHVPRTAARQPAGALQRAARPADAVPLQRASTGSLGRAGHWARGMRFMPHISARCAGLKTCARAENPRSLARFSEPAGGALQAGSRARFPKPNWGALQAGSRARFPKPTGGALQAGSRGRFLMPMRSSRDRSTRCRPVTGALDAGRVPPGTPVTGARLVPRSKFAGWAGSRGRSGRWAPKRVDTGGVAGH